MLVGKLCHPLSYIRVSKLAKLGQLVPPGMLLCIASVKGYMNKGTFYEYAERWVQYLRRKSRLDKTNILLLDVHKSHIYN